MDNSMRDEAHELWLENEKLKHDINELNARLLERQVAFNEADKRRLAKIADLENLLKIAYDRIDRLKKGEEDVYQ